MRAAQALGQTAILLVWWQLARGFRGVAWRGWEHTAFAIGSITSRNVRLPQCLSARSNQASCRSLQISSSPAYTLAAKLYKPSPHWQHLL